MLLRWFSGGRTARCEKPPCRRMQPLGRPALLRCEHLEDRCVPATYTWTGAIDVLASKPGNWTGGDPTRAPGAFDSLVFNGGGTCVMDTVTKVQDIDIRAGYAGTIRITTFLGNPSSLEVTNSFHMVGTDGVIANSFAGGWSYLYLTGSSSFTWSGGKSWGVDFVLGSSTNHGVIGRIDDHVWFNNSALENYGMFTWVTGRIMVDAGNTSWIYNRPGGTFEVQSAGPFSATDPPERNVGLFTNQGDLRFTSSGVRIAADFLNAGGTVRRYPGLVQLDYKAEQTSGTFELRGGTVKTAGSDHALRIYDGSILGQGTVDGNLTLGYDPALGPPPRTFPTISPGIGGGNLGTITINQSFQIFSPDAYTVIDVNSTGIDKIAVLGQGGYAALNGDLVVNIDPAYTPPHPTDLSFLTAPAIRGDFLWISYTNDANEMTWPDPRTGKQVHWTAKKNLAGTSYDVLTEIDPGSPPPSPPVVPPPPPPSPPPPPP